MRNSNQQGFSAVMVLGVLVIFGIISFTGWKVYDSSRAVKPVESSTSPQTVAVKESPKKEESKIPEGFVAYENEELGFKFSYPKEWGQITVSDARMEKVDTGKRWLLEFSEDKKVSMGLTSKNWTTAAGRGGACSIADGSDNQSLPNPQPLNTNDTVLKILDKSDDYFLTEIAQFAYCENVKLIADYIFADSKDYLTLKLQYETQVFSTQKEFDDYKINSSKYVPQVTIETLKKVTKSIEDI